MNRITPAAACSSSLYVLYIYAVPGPEPELSGFFRSSLDYLMCHNFHWLCVTALKDNRKIHDSLLPYILIIRKFHGPCEFKGYRLDMQDQAGLSHDDVQPRPDQGEGV